MRNWRLLVAIALIGAIAGVGWVYAQGRGSSNTFTGQDIAEIEQLYARYTQGLDFQDEELYLSAWADDAVFTTGGGEVWAGTEALRRRFQQGGRPDGRGHHDHAQQHQYLDRGYRTRSQRTRLLDRARHERAGTPHDASWPLLRHVRADPRRLADQDARVDAGLESDSMGYGVQIDSLLIRNSPPQRPDRNKPLRAPARGA